LPGAHTVFPMVREETIIDMKARLVFYPPLFAVYFVISSLSLLTDQIPTSQALRSLLVLPAITLLITVVFFKSVRNWDRACFLSFVLLVWLLFFGHLYNILIGSSILPSININPWTMLGTWTLMLAVLASNWGWKRLNNPQMVSTFLNLTSLIVIIPPIIRLTTFYVENANSNQALASVKPIEMTYQQVSTVSKPDIYYFVLDGYGRSDVLREIYGFDNSDFLKYLRDKGFYVADQSRSNYIQTSLSLASSLNFGYINDLSNVLLESNNREPLKTLINNNRAQSFLKSLGYETITFSSGYYFTEERDSDLYLTPYNDISLNEFEQLCLSITAFSMVIEPLRLDISVPSFDTHRTRIRYAFENLARIPDVNGPKFVFIHILAPHPPFVFDRDGKPIESGRSYSIGDGDRFTGSKEEYVSGYVNQVMYINKLLKDAIDAILERSGMPPIILLQGDHGPGLLLDWVSLEASCAWERSSILNAYYLPGYQGSDLYSSMTPVNSFRVILDSFFDIQLGLLEDHSYYSAWEFPYKFINMSNEIDLKNNCQPVATPVMHFHPDKSLPR
jgi:hypothetical protein